MTERIQKILSARGVASRRQAEDMIRAGKVTCNGKICVIGDTADPETDEIMVEGHPLPALGVKDSTPILPKLETVKLPPESLSGLIAPSRHSAANVLTALEISRRLI